MDEVLSFEMAVVSEEVEVEEKVSILVVILLEKERVKEGNMMI